MRSIAASPNLPEIALGFDNGQVARIDLATGTVLAVTPGAGLPVVAVDYTTLGTLVWADAGSVYSDLAAAPIYTATQAIADLSVGKAPTASATPFGTGCGGNASVQWLTSGAPTLGNSTFQIAFTAYPVAPLVLVALGTSRTASTLLGVGLPFDLAPVGAPGCDLLVDPETVLAFPTFSGVQLVIPIPNNPALAGQSFFAQGFVRQTSNPLGLEATPGLACVLR
ncbi:MAG: hypothetical protein JNK15_17315 [Planctomycetes bacterium]|nr:hypothetical protein [Planctomycetota bacterium]